MCVCVSCALVLTLMAVPHCLCYEPVGYDGAAWAWAHLRDLMCLPGEGILVFQRRFQLAHVLATLLRDCL